MGDGAPATPLAQFLEELIWRKEKSSIFTPLRCFFEWMRLMYSGASGNSI